MEIIKNIDSFLEWCWVTKNFSKYTIEQYERHIKYFNKYLLEEVCVQSNIEQLTLENINNFRVFLYKEDNNKRSIQTVNAYIISIRSFLKFLEKKWYQVLSPTRIDLNNVKHNRIVFLEINELVKLFRQCSQDSLIWLRNKTIMKLLFSTWLRVSELVWLNIWDINLNSRELVVKWKWGKIRTVYISRDTVKLLRLYLKMRITSNNALFITFKSIWGNRVTRFYITTMIKRYARKAWILKNISAHTIRHSFATTLLNNWADLRSIQELLWHSSIKTTQLYTHITNNKLKEVHDKYFRYSWM